MVVFHGDLPYVESKKSPITLNKHKSASFTSCGPNPVTSVTSVHQHTFHFVYTGFSFLPSVATCWESTPKLLTLIRGNQPLARHPGSGMPSHIGLNGIPQQIARWAQKPLGSRVGYNSTWKGEKNPSDPSMKPFAGFINPSITILGAHLCAKHFYQTKACPLVGLVKIFHFILPKTSLFGLALLYLPYKAYMAQDVFQSKFIRSILGGDP